MPRIRSVHPELCEDEVLASLPASAERTFVRMWPHLDDEGRAEDRPKLWKARLYPVHDDMTVEAVALDVDSLVDAGLLIRYEVDGKHYLCAKPDAWKRWQRPQRPTKSKLPALGESSTHPPRVVREPSATPHPVVEGRVGEEEQEGRGSGGGDARADSEPVAPPLPPAERGELVASHHGQHPNCRACGTSRRVQVTKPPEPRCTIPDAGPVLAELRNLKTGTMPPALRGGA